MQYHIEGNCCRARITPERRWMIAETTLIMTPIWFVLILPMGNSCTPLCAARHLCRSLAEGLWLILLFRVSPKRNHSGGGALRPLFSRCFGRAQLPINWPWL